VALDLWEKSTEDVRERWRDIARTLQETGDAEAVPRALQTCFWFGAETSRHGASVRAELTLHHLLPHELVGRLRRPANGSGGPEAGESLGSSR